MGPYLPADALTHRRPSGVWYDLKGVLMHKGQSAHHGHYVAQVFDETRAKWFLFDDEAVDAIDDLNAPTVHDDEDDDGEPVVAKKKKLAAGFTRNKDGTMCVAVPPSSRSCSCSCACPEGTRADAPRPACAASPSPRTPVRRALPLPPPLPSPPDLPFLTSRPLADMLIYTRRASTASGPPSASSTSSTAAAAAAAAAAPEPTPPALAQSTVERLDTAYRADVDAYARQAADVERRFDEVREGKRRVYRSWAVEEDDVRLVLSLTHTPSFECSEDAPTLTLLPRPALQEESFLVDKVELRRWLEDGLKVRKPASDEDKDKDKDKGEEPAEGEAKREEGAVEGPSGDVEMADGAEGDKSASAEGDEDVKMAPAPASTAVAGDDGPSTPAKPPQSTLGAQLDSASAASNGDAHAADSAPQQINGKGKGKALDQDQDDEPDELPHPSKLGNGTASASTGGDKEIGAGAVEEVKTISNANVVCEHGKADPRRAEQMKRVSQVRSDLSLSRRRSRCEHLADENVVDVHRWASWRCATSACRSRPSSSSRATCAGTASAGSQPVRPRPSPSSRLTMDRYLTLLVEHADYRYAFEHPERVAEYDAANNDRNPRLKTFTISKTWAAGASPSSLSSTCQQVAAADSALARRAQTGAACLPRCTSGVRSSTRARRTSRTAPTSSARTAASSPTSSAAPSSWPTCVPPLARPPLLVVAAPSCST